MTTAAGKKNEALQLQLCLHAQKKSKTVGALGYLAFNLGELLVSLPLVALRLEFAVAGLNSSIHAYDGR